MEIMKMPQDLNLDLELAIRDLNFREPLEIDSHIYMAKINAWMPSLYKPSIYNVNKEITEINTKLTFNQMIVELKKSDIWAVDLEHCEHSYSGITCLIQISTTTKNFLIDPFKLNKEIKTVFAPLMESENHLKIMHGCFNDMKWLQRDFNIFAWPVVDTQMIFRYIKRLQGVTELRSMGDFNNISLNNLLKYYNIIISDLKPFSLALNFRPRPLPDHIKEYAMQGTLYLLPVLSRLWSDFEYNSIYDGSVQFDDLFKQSTIRLSKKALYPGKIYPSDLCVNYYPVKYNSETMRISNYFTLLNNWRSDLAKMLDTSPNMVLSTLNLAGLLSIKMPAQISDIEQSVTTPWNKNIITQKDLYTIKEILNQGKYRQLDKCVICKQYPYYIPGTRNNFCNDEVLLLTDWSPDTEILGGDIDSVPRLNLQTSNERYGFFTSRFSYSKSNQIGRYVVSASDLHSILCIIRCGFSKIHTLLQCSICHQIVKKAVIPGCTCLSSLCCKICWVESQPRISHSPECKLNLTQIEPIEFEAADKIICQYGIFCEKIQGAHCLQILPAIVRLLTACELEIMCKLCNQHFEDTMMVRIKNTSGVVSSHLFCYGCDIIIKLANEVHGERIPIICFDKVTVELTNILNHILNHCTSKRYKAVGDKYNVYGSKTTVKIIAIVLKNCDYFRKMLISFYDKLLKFFTILLSIFAGFISLYITIVFLAIFVAFVEKVYTAVKKA